MSEQLAHDVSLVHQPERFIGNIEQNIVDSKHGGFQILMVRLKSFQNIYSVIVLWFT
jgi:hypothetical protein